MSLLTVVFVIAFVMLPAWFLTAIVCIDLMMFTLIARVRWALLWSQIALA